ncbi:carboxypeptidase-like regulatory domain-containing protein [Flavobacterium sp.]|jgi:hypothetical protein|uniref:carboxypeptidase-like regulatory domain-containing protein n=1 Tax=Flavobacterium sp. TaxID=239 RepID=UPI0037C06B95
MHISYKYFLLFVILLSVFEVHSQIIQGTILDNTTKETLPGATIYLDGTTISTISDFDGNFSINTRGNNATLVVSFIGYATFRLNNPLQYVNKKLNVMVEKESINLDEVVIGKGPFSRKQMMTVFREQFLGESKSGKSCKIENEDDIILHYDVSNNTLNASSRNPLKIKNSYLGYEVNFDLNELVVQYNYKSLERHHQMQSFFSGTTFYKDISKNNKADKRRKETFYGSATHLVHTIAHNAWEKEDIKLFVNGLQTNPLGYFQVSDSLQWKKVRLIKEPQMEVRKVKTEKNAKGQIIIVETDEYEMKPTNFNILYQKDKQSFIEFREKVIFVDKNGNYNPIFAIGYGGYIGNLKAGDMLPINYFETIKESQ